MCCKYVPSLSHSVCQNGQKRTGDRTSLSAVFSARTESLKERPIRERESNDKKRFWQIFANLPLNIFPRAWLVMFESRWQVLPLVSADLILKHVVVFCLSRSERFCDSEIYRTDALVAAICAFHANEARTNVKLHSFFFYRESSLESLQKSAIATPKPSKRKSFVSIEGISVLEYKAHRVARGSTQSLVRLSEEEREREGRGKGK